MAFGSAGVTTVDKNLSGGDKLPLARYQKGFIWQAPVPNTELLDRETGRGSKTGEQSYPVYGKKERSY